MPYSLPSFTQLKQQVLADIQSMPFVTSGLLPKSILRYLGYAIAQQAYLHSEHLRYIALQSVPFTASDEFLSAWAALKGVNRLAATPASGQVTFTGVANSAIVAATTATRQDGIGYYTANSATISNGSAVVTMIATTAGSATNLSTGVTVTLATSVTGVNSVATVTTAMTNGSDQETDVSLRTRMLEAFQALGESGSVANFNSWATSTGNITRVWCNPSGAGPGTVVIYICLDTIESATNGFPVGSDGVATNETRWTTKATGDQLLVANQVFLSEPATALVFVCSPIPQHIAVSIQSLSNSSPSVQAAIVVALQSLCVSIGSPLGCSIFPSSISAAIQGAAGIAATFTLLSPVAEITLSTGFLPEITVLDVTFS